MIFQENDRVVYTGDTLFEAGSDRKGTVKESFFFALLDTEVALVQFDGCETDKVAYAHNLSKVEE